MVGSDRRKREVEKEIAETESRLYLISSGQLAATAQEKVRLQEKLDVACRHLRATPPQGREQYRQQDRDADQPTTATR
jgi:hypothetical protein